MILLSDQNVSSWKVKDLCRKEFDFDGHNFMPPLLNFMFLYKKVEIFIKENKYMKKA